ncbi:MAG: hypothetical protein KJ568_03665 [Actinobacteria bacterium]|nr:hypothetical protein [Actinomycetota bacterium]
MVSEDIVIISGKQLRCLIFGFSEFKKVYTKLNRKWLASFGAEMFGEEGVAYICKNCGYKLEFYPKR